MGGSLKRLAGRWWFWPALVSVICVLVFIITFLFLLIKQQSHTEVDYLGRPTNSIPVPQKTTETASTDKKSTETQQTSGTNEIAKTDDKTLTSNDFVTYDNGVKLQADNASKAFKNGLDDIFTKYQNGTYSLDKVRLQSGQVQGIFNVTNDLFKNEKTPSGLEKVTGEYTAEIQQMQEILSELQSVVSAEQVAQRQQMAQTTLSQKDATDKEYADIKAAAMKQASTDAKSATTTASDSHLKDGPAKVANAGGLGDTYETIVAAFGDPTQVNQPMKDGTGMFVFQNSKILADFVQSRAYHVTYQLDDNPLTMDQAQELAKKLIPPDAVFVKKYTKDGQEYDVYQSKMLDPLFDHNWFENADGVYQPGYFDIAYLTNGDNVTSVDAFTSDNP